jgi:hypothetical protein
LSRQAVLDSKVIPGGRKTGGFINKIGSLLSTALPIGRKICKGLEAVGSITGKGEGRRHKKYLRRSDL